MVRVVCVHLVRHGAIGLLIFSFSRCEILVPLECIHRIVIQITVVQPLTIVGHQLDVKDAGRILRQLEKYDRRDVDD